MLERTIPLVAHVECRSESRGEEQPIALTLGGQRITVAAILERSFVAAAVAGVPVRARFTIGLEDGSLALLERVLPAGAWKAWRINPL